MLEGRKRRLDRAAKHTTRSSSPAVNESENGSFRSPNEDNIMTRKPIRIRRPRIPILQSGYCAICNLPYNSIEDHVQSKKHQKLIGEDANYIALNGYLHSDVGIESLLSLTGIEAIGFDDFSPKPRRRNMPRTRASSVVSDIVKSDIVKSTQMLENDTGHKLRSRKNVNYMTPPLDEDSFQEKPEKKAPTPDLEPVRLEYKEYRELRSSTRALAKLTSMQDNPEPDVWESGRPKRACIGRHKRISADERLVSDNKTYYKVEVLSSKLRSSDRDKGISKQKEAKVSDTDKGLIVKFKKLRNSELIQLNNEATNFLFPKKDDSTDDDGEDDAATNETEEDKESASTENNEVSSTSEIEEVKPPDKIKAEDESSMDSIASTDCKRAKKRRSHAEAFIMDNQKYYKFETPGSRLRYHGSYLSPVPTNKANGDIAKVESKVEKEDKVEKKEEKKVEKTEEKLDKKDKEKPERLNLNLDEFKFSFETVPENETWYQTFRRQDRCEQSYDFSNNYHWNDFVLPYQIPHLKAIDPRTCYNSYKALKECICKAVAETQPEAECSGSNDVDICDEVEENTSQVETVEQPDEDSKDSKLSEASSSSNANSEEVKEITSMRGRRRRSDLLPSNIIISPTSGKGKNARKSPRQHASTLAILSSLVNQRKRRSRSGQTENTSNNLPTIVEEPPPPPPPPVVEEKPVEVPVETSRRVVETKPATPQRQRRKKVDYFAIAAKIEEELNTALDFDTDFEPTTDPDTSFLDSTLNVHDILKLYDKSKANDNENSCRRFFNGAPGRKPGKRKINMTGWPNKVKRKRVVKEERTENGGNADSSEESDSINVDDRENKCDQDRENRVGNSSEIRDTILQPYVYVKKIDNCAEFGVKKIIIKSPRKRTVNRPQRRIVSPSKTVKSPRILRRVRAKGRWYRDR